MALQTVGQKALAVKEAASETSFVKISKKNVLDEDAYTDGLQKIIQRDFFPDLNKLEAQSEYLEALEKNDTEKLREIHIKYGPKRKTTEAPSIYSTPATFETPVENPRQTPGGSTSKDRPNTVEDEPTHNPEKKDHEKEAPGLTLDKYLAKNTSEDNASFTEIMRENEEKHRQKHGWMYDMEERHEANLQQNLALPGIEQQAIEAGTSEIQGWKYQAKNHLMYVPDGCSESAKEKIASRKVKPRIIVHKNTRFQNNPFDMRKNQETIAQVSAAQAQLNHGKIGVDGKELLPEQSPKVNGFGFVATPSPAPGVDESPLMTWGEIEGTPFRLDGGTTPINDTPGPIFKIPDVPRRDQIGFALAEQASKAHRAKKEEALKRVKTRLTSPALKFGSTNSVERLHSLSPAAQQLASQKLGIRTNTDKALRASYTPSPSRLPGDKTPISLTPTRTPKSARNTPKTRVTPKRGNTSEVSSITDNLLNLPKRSRATDFF